MVLTGDYHTHTPYSHGKNEVEENVAKAKELGLKQVAITDHGYSHVAFGLRRYQTPWYIEECKAAQEKYGIDVLVGIESNIRGIDGKGDLKERDYEKFDVYLCGNHIYIWYDTLGDCFRYGYVNFLADKLGIKPSEKRIRYNTTAYINSIKNNPIDAVTHLNYICPANALEVAKCAADYGTYIELNSKKTHLTDDELADIVAKTEARFIVNSDAHAAWRVGDTKRVDEQLARLNFPMDRIDNIDGRLPNFRFAEFKKHM